MKASVSRLLEELGTSRTWDDPEQRFRGELVLGFGSFESLVTALFCVSELAWGTASLGLLYGVALLPMLAVLAWTYRGGDVRRASVALVALLFLLTTATNVGTGGHAIGANIALPTFVLFAVVLSSPRAGLAWTALVLVEIVLVAYLRRSRLHFPITPDPEWVKSAIDRVPLFFSLASALIGVVMRRALVRFRMELGRERSRFTDFAQIAADGFWETDADLRLTFVSPGFAQAMGLEASAMLGLRPDQAYRLQPPEGSEPASCEAPMLGRRAFAGQLLKTVDAAGAEHVLLNQGRPIHAGADGFAGYRGVVQDISNQRKAEAFLRDSEKRLRLITDTLPALVAYVDHEERYRYRNAMHQQVLGADSTFTLGRTMREVRGEEVYAGLADHVKRALAGERVSFEMSGNFEGRAQFFSSVFVPDVDAAGRVAGFYAMAFDITAQKEVEAKLRQLTEIDGLTGVANRNLFNERLAEVTADAGKAGESSALAFLDLDNFKTVNDQFGHDAGDSVLREFATRLSHNVRPSDTVARLSGDEFVVILGSLASPGDAALVAAKIIAAMKAPFQVPGSQVQVSCSIGVAIRKPGESGGETLRRADAALYEVKATGRGTFLVAA